MGKIKQGILGGFSGRVGGVVGSSWKGIDVVKSRPLSVSNPRTAGQIAQRTAFANVVLFATQILAAVIKPLWDRFQIKKSGYNAFVSSNIAFFDANGLINPSALVISKGKMESTAIAASSQAYDNDTIEVNWVDDSGSGYKLANDKAYIVVYNETQDIVAVSAGESTRNAANADVILPTNYNSADNIHVYLAFRRSDGTIVSNTSYRLVVAP